MSVPKVLPLVAGDTPGSGVQTVWLQRLSYVGELGWEIFAPASETPRVFAALQQAGAEFDIRNVGLHAVNSLRLEKGFRHWGHDIGSEDNLFQAGLSFAAKPDAGDFAGRVMRFCRQKASGLARSATGAIQTG